MITLQVNATEPIGWPTRLGAVTIPRPSEKCQTDASVQKAVAPFGAAVATVMGGLSCFTAGYWGQVREQSRRNAQKFDFKSSRTDTEGL